MIGINKFSSFTSLSINFFYGFFWSLSLPFLSLSLFHSLSLYLSLSPSFSLYIFLSLILSLHLSPYVHISFSLSLSSSFFLSLCLPFFFSLSISRSLSLYLSLSLLFSCSLFTSFCKNRNDFRDTLANFQRPEIRKLTKVKHSLSSNFKHLTNINCP